MGPAPALLAVCVKGGTGFEDYPGLQLLEPGRGQGHLLEAFCPLNQQNLCKGGRGKGGKSQKRGKSLVLPEQRGHRELAGWNRSLGRAEPPREDTLGVLQTQPLRISPRGRFTGIDRGGAFGCICY